MRIYLSVDMEGVNGICHSSQTKPGEAGYERGVSLMHAEANAVIEGAVEAGAREILVNDSHNDMRNLRAELLHPAAQLVSGWQKPHSMVAGAVPWLDAGEEGSRPDCAIFVGYHARAGTARGVLSHTYRPRVFQEIRLNGETVGETGLNAAFLGCFEVPVALVTGDDSLCLEAVAELGAVKTLAVKQAVSRYSAIFSPQDECLKALRSTTYEALSDRNCWILTKPASPCRLEIIFSDPAMADGAVLVPGVERIDDKTVTFSHENYPVAFKVMLAVGAIGATRLDPYF